MPEYSRPVARVRRGFNIIELLAALAIFGILLLFGAPRLWAVRDRGTVRSAKQQLHGYLMTARAAALRNGTPATFHASEGAIWVTQETTSGTDEVIAAPIPVAEPLVLSGTIDIVRYDPRGFATNLGGKEVFRVTGAGYTDSLCVSKLGNVTPGCGF